VGNAPNPNITPANAAVCSGNSITLTASGGTSYLWSTNQTTASVTVNPTVNTVYSVTVTGANGCTAAISRNVTVNALPVININPPVASVCTGSSITLTASGANNYVWSNNATTASITVSPISNTTYSVTGTDANGCTATASRDVVIASNLTINISPLNASVCSGASVILTASGANNYVWSNNATTASITVSPISNTTYSVTGTDVNGCTGTATRNVTLHPDPVVSITPAQPVICEGASATLTASGANNYVWSNNATTASITVSPISSTTYSVTGTDANGCTAAASRQVTVNPPPSISIQPANAAVCVGESIALIASGGVTYAWSNNETTSFITVSPTTQTTYTVTVTDANGCTAASSRNVIVNSLPVAAINPPYTQICSGQQLTLTASGGVSYVWSTSQTTASINIMPQSAATYSVTVTDGNNCSATANADVDIINNLSVSEQHTDISCFNGNNGTIDVSIITGTAPFTYLWNDNVTTEDRVGLSAGVYSLTVSGSDGCAATITVDITQPAAITVSETITNESCAGSQDGSITLTPNGGTAPYIYLWSDNDNANPKNNLSLGNYSVTITDNNGCSINQSFEVGRNAAISIAPVVNNPSCFPAADGSIELTVNGGNGGFVFQWSDNSVRQNAYNLLPGTYTVTVTDSKGCTATAGPFTLAYQYVFSISATPLDTTITKGLGVQINVSPNSYHAVQYTWIPPDGLSCTDCSSPVARPMQTTTYKVIAINAAGCSDSTAVIIQVKNPGAIYIPNSFSPNGDGANDLFMIYGIKPEFLESFHISVFDRWGERVFSAEQAGFAWDGTYKGKLLDPGVFIYHLKFVLQGGDIIEERKGSLLLLR
jgi:gliding motility-associated-like protein